MKQLLALCACHSADFVAQKKVVATAPAADVFSVAQNGSLQPVATVPVVRGAHCVVLDDRGRAWVCDPTAEKP
ncbi:MAG TPA: hypothetical protein VGH28_28325 [Polyangiaceae bacterium]|jgi:hypothetical protein